MGSAQGRHSQIRPLPGHISGDQALSFPFVILKTIERPKRGFPLPGTDGGDREHSEPGMEGTPHRCQQSSPVRAAGEKKRGDSEVNAFVFSKFNASVLDSRSWTTMERGRLTHWSQASTV